MQAAEQAGLRLDADRLRKLIQAGRSLVSNGQRARGRALDVPIVIGDETSLTLHLADKRDGAFDAADEETAVVLAGWAAIAVENAQLYRETDQRRAELERSVRALEPTSEIARVVGGETRLDRVLELIAARSRALLDARGVMILLADAEEFVVAATAGNVSRELLGRRMQSTNARLRTARADRGGLRVHALDTRGPWPRAELGGAAGGSRFSAQSTGPRCSRRCQLCTQRRHEHS